MKYFLLFFPLAMFILSCEQREWDNPFDPNCPKVTFTPENFQSVQQNNLIKLTWSQTNNHISGFKIERRVGDGTWQEVTSQSKSIYAWNDDQITGGTLYEYRLYAFAGENQSNQVSTQVTPLFAATLTTTVPSDITSTTATSGGKITDDGGVPVISRGVCWNTTGNPTIADSITTNGTGTGSFTSSLTGLTAKTIYYVRAYAINSQGTAYGSQVSFTTSQILTLPTVMTSSASNVTSTSALLGGNVITDGNATVTERGICYGTLQNPTTTDNRTAIGSGTGSFSATITGLKDTTLYYVKAYAINNQGTSYGDQVIFITLQTIGLPIVTTNPITVIAQTSATGGGTVTSDGDATVTSRGVCWNTTGNPTISNNKTTDGIGTGIYTSIITGLIANTTYFVRAYATNSQGTAYGNQDNFNTLQSIGLPTVITTSISEITKTTATCGGTVTSDGGATVTSRGICWNTTGNPTITNNKSIDGIGTGIYVSSLTGLFGSTTYYVRAYASNNHGIAYGSQVNFTTSPEMGNFTDSRDDKIYKWVKIGTQYWMAENLAYLPSVNPPTIGSDKDPYYYVNGYYGTSITEAKATFNYTTYGVLYNWCAAMAGSTSSDLNPSGIKGICPNGWHLPSDAEWTILSECLINNGFGYGGSGDAIAKSMAAKTNWSSDAKAGTPGNDPTSNNRSGFSGLPSGYRESGGAFSSLGWEGRWWDTVEISSQSAGGRVLYHQFNGFYEGGANKLFGHGVRCIKD